MLKTVVVRFGILERISIRSYVFATVGTVERPFPAKTYHSPKTLFGLLQKRIFTIFNAKLGSTIPSLCLMLHAARLQVSS
jgi:hypothetical protein